MFCLFPRPLFKLRDLKISFFIENEAENTVDFSIEIQIRIVQKLVRSFNGSILLPEMLEGYRFHEKVHFDRKYHMQSLLKIEQLI